MSVYYTVLTNRSIKWEKYMKKYKFDDYNNNNNVLKRYIRKGIPCKQKQFVKLLRKFIFIIFFSTITR